MMAAKARTHNEMGTHHSIMMAPDQATIKRLGRSMPNYNEDLWSQIRPAVLLAGNTLKFGQNSNLSSKLLLTSLSHLAEASATDAICGIGISVKDAYIVHLFIPGKSHFPTVFGSGFDLTLRTDQK